jgi:hypothetical protein
MAVVLPIANELEARLIDNCFKHRRGEQVKLNNSLTEIMLNTGGRNSVNGKRQL